MVEEELHHDLSFVGKKHFQIRRVWNEEIAHPEAALERVKDAYRVKGYDDDWIEARIRGNVIGNELTDEWRGRGANEEAGDFAILTNVLIEGTFGLTVASYKTYQLLPTRANLRDHMTPLELALTSLSEATAIDEMRFHFPMFEHICFDGDCVFHVVYP